MKYVKYLVLGILFGIVLSKSEVISWFRIQEMFRFQSFHMYGVIGSAVILGVMLLWLAKRQEWKNQEGRLISLQPKERGFLRYILGGTLFGMGWALTGACPGPVYILIGHGFVAYLIVFLGAFVGVLLYGGIKRHLPH